MLGLEYRVAVGVPVDPYICGAQQAEHVEENPMKNAWNDLEWCVSGRCARNGTKNIPHLAEKIGTFPHDGVQIFSPEVGSKN